MTFSRAVIFSPPLLFSIDKTWFILCTLTLTEKGGEFDQNSVIIGKDMLDLIVWRDVMLSPLIKNGYGNDQDLNCAEKILSGANIAYNLGLDNNALKAAAGFGGGMAVESVCGALTASIMVLGRLFVVKNAHESTRIKDLTRELLERYTREMSDINCGPLKEKYRTEELKCHLVILKAAEILDSIVQRETGPAAPQRQ